MRERPEWLKDVYARSERLKPGLYKTPEGNLIFNITEMLGEIGLPDTPENRELCRRALTELCEEHKQPVKYLGPNDPSGERPGSH